MGYFQNKYVAHQYRKNPKDFPNQCDLCGLRVQFKNDNIHANSIIEKGHILKKVNFANPPLRVIHSAPYGPPEANVTYFCALAKTKYWNQKFKKCPDFQLKLPSSELSLSDYLAIHHSRNNSRIAFYLGILASILTLIGIIVTAVT